MTTIPWISVSDARGLAKEIYTEIMRTYDLEEPRESYMVMGHTPAHLAASWKRSLLLFGTRTGLSLKEKHLLTIALSGFNGSEYCVRGHTDRARQLKTTEAELTELMMVVSTVAGTSRRAVLEATVEDGRFPYIPSFSFQGSSTARIANLCFKEDGRLGLRTKHTVAFAIASASGADILVGYHGKSLKAMGVPDPVFVEVFLIVDLVCGYNRYGQGVQVGPPKSFGSAAAANAASGGSENW